MGTPAGWQHDPYGRFVQRYWDGQQWTARVIDAAGTELVDPMGTSTVIPFTVPESAGGPAIRPAAPPRRHWWNRWRRHPS